MLQETESESNPQKSGISSMLFSKLDLKKLIIPLMVEQTLALTVGMIDTVMIASVGESAVSGVSLVESINILLITLLTALAAGGAIVAGQYLGKQEQENGRLAAKQLIISVFLLALAIAILCVALNGPILSLIFGQIETDVMAHAKTYFYLTALSYPFIALYNACAALFRSMGDSKTAMLNALIMNLVNIVGNSIFIFGFHWGVFGAALATLLSRVISAIAMVLMLRNPKRLLYVRNYRLRDLNLNMTKRILTIAVPNGLENSMFQIGKIILASLVTLYGTSAITANAVGNSLAMIEIIPGQAIGMALLTVVSRCVGAGEYEQARYYIKTLMKKGYLYIILLNIPILLLLKYILGIYQLSEETNAMAMQIMILHGIFSMTIWPASFSLPNAFRAAGDVKYTMVIAVVSMWVFRICLSYFFYYFFDLGVLGVWIAMMADWMFRSICFVRHYFSGHWQRNAVV